MPDKEDIRCQDCGQPLATWAEPHSMEDCEWWKATQPMRDALVSTSELQATVNLLTGEQR